MYNDADKIIHERNNSTTAVLYMFLNNCKQLIICFNMCIRKRINLWIYAILALC